MMECYIVRHGFTGVTRDAREAYGLDGPPLAELGKKQAEELGANLQRLGVDLALESVAVSEYLRTKQTAELAGFTDIQVRPVLNEIFTGIPNDELKAMLEQRKLPMIVLEKAQTILDNPPKEKIWITHGLVIMGLRQLLGAKSDPFDPSHCGIIQLQI